MSRAYLKTHEQPHCTLGRFVVCDGCHRTFRQKSRRMSRERFCSLTCSQRARRYVQQQPLFRMHDWIAAMQAPAKQPRILTDVRRSVYLPPPGFTGYALCGQWQGRR